MNYTIALMDNLLQWAKSQMQSESIMPQEIDISSLINGVIKLLRLQAKAKGVTLTANVPKAAYVYADKDMINLVLRNLVSNAIKFTVANGEVNIDTKEDDGFIIISIRDTGIGMAPEVLEKILAKNFYTTKGTDNESGTGLGLMLCNDFLKKNGSVLRIKSEVEKGSTFSFRLALQTEEC
jgi:two-component system, sensor histidine kinase and response regulator